MLQKNSSPNSNLTNPQISQHVCYSAKQLGCYFSSDQTSEASTGDLHLLRSRSTPPSISGSGLCPVAISDHLLLRRSPILSKTQTPSMPQQDPTESRHRPYRLS